MKDCPKKQPQSKDENFQENKITVGCSLEGQKLYSVGIIHFRNLKKRRI